MTVEYYLLVQIYSHILQEAVKTKSLTVKVKLPKFTTILESWRHQRFLRLDKEEQTLG